MTSSPCTLRRTAASALRTVPAAPRLSDGHLVPPYCIGGVPSAREALLGGDDPLLEAWKEGGELPCAFAVWAAHGDTDPDTVEALQHALTYGLERSYEAVLSSPFASDPQRGYDTLSHFDYIFHNQKNQARRQVWDSAVTVAPRAQHGRRSQQASPRTH